MQELERRLQAKESLPKFIEYLETGFELAAHHRLICKELEALERGETKNLMLTMPPGSAKSTYGSTLFPSWFLGRNPKLSVIAASHTQDLADRFGRRVRNIVASNEFRNVFDFGVAEDSAAAGRWDTEHGGEYFAAGVGGPITGRRADLGLIDDPVKSREDADSERMRDRAWDWYVNDFMTRLKPGARQVLIMTRWHEDDLGGRILERDADQWKVVSLPMIAEPDDPLGREVGERLWADWFTDEMVERAKKDARSWNALYQQKPAPDEGDYFNADWFSEYDELPEGLQVIGASDYAVSEGKGDFTEHGVAGWDGKNLYIMDWWRGQTKPDVWIDRYCDMIVDHEPSKWFGESGVIRSSLEPAINTRMRQREAWCHVEYLPSMANKEARARSIQALASMGNVWLPKQAPWKAELLSQLLSFPSGKFDDGVDVMSLFGRGLRMLGKPKKKFKKTAPKQVIGAQSWMSA